MKMQRLTVGAVRGQYADGIPKVAVDCPFNFLIRSKQTQQSIDGHITLTSHFGYGNYWIDVRVHFRMRY